MATSSLLSYFGNQEQKSHGLTTLLPKLHPIGRLWFILKKDVCKRGVQFTSKDALWNKIVQVRDVIYPLSKSKD